ncbi:hypothetical protein KAFR_0D04480 [Kazachstania africana CBS 2517]|uniref:Uncharacterized protein n=1 Tax=Kazachstania africana (strain ATCC 22294 / BCRC 22015 / CBS 2517 / CECT 1963 / NBRC 1671 / NRRL Y-8276) TaxID=1071382 RepID=H2AUP6_KAZAF|nr:hypothetical protein KAFR_0D04480 [Kazachstania africana CBS 2517]CCF58096.1 hypothetical protein KAFR_0D04480 [Kazachstania africana CBS 2517]
MERLNSLEKVLPPEQPPTKQAIESLNSELSQDFKIAANAVAKLYRVANEKNSLCKYQGYLNCLDDILGLLNDGSVTSVDDIKLWCLKQRNDILPSNNNDQKAHGNHDFNFCNTNEANNNSSVPKFKLSMPPLSVELSDTAVTGVKYRRKCLKAKREDIAEDKTSFERENLPITSQNDLKELNRVPGINKTHDSMAISTTLSKKQKIAFFRDEMRET